MSMYVSEMIQARRCHNLFHMWREEKEKTQEGADRFNLFLLQPLVAKDLFYLTAETLNSDNEMVFRTKKVKINVISLLNVKLVKSKFAVCLKITI